jgi:hypothetical protein
MAGEDACATVRRWRFRFALARACRGIKAVPIFWMATEDHDIAEVDHCDVVDGESILSQVRYEAGPEDFQKPVGKVVFSDSIEKARSQFLETLPNSEFRQQIDAILAASYHPGNSFARAFGQVMAALFSNYGLILVDPQDERLKRLVKPIFEKVVANGQEYQAKVMDRSQRLVAAGYHAQVLVEPDASLLFVEDNGRRDAPPDAAFGAVFHCCLASIVIDDLQPEAPARRRLAVAVLGFAVLCRRCHFLNFSRTDFCQALPSQGLSPICPVFL